MNTFFGHNGVCYIEGLLYFLQQYIFARAIHEKDLTNTIKNIISGIQLDNN